LFGIRAQWAGAPKPARFKNVVSEVVSMSDMNFADKVALVTGAGGGIGRAASLALARRGARVVVVDFAREQGLETEQLIREEGAESLFVQADVSQAEDVARYVHEAVARFGGRIEAFINNAAWQGLIAPVVDYPDEVFDRVMAINVRGVFLGLKHVLPVMLSHAGGAVVNTASIAAYIGTRNLAAYTASKHAVLGLTKSVAQEVARKGVRVNAVCPGPVDTPMLRAIEAEQSGGDSEALRRRRASSIPEGRYAKPEEVANLMLYLLSDLSTHITGQGLQINGGAYS
jgi:NAD(P)-dependent dehydrogenase (short-subunit alcohol dehydrogenase family)